MQTNENRTDDLAIYTLAGVFAIVGLLWVGGITSAVVCGHHVPHGHTAGAVLAFAHTGDPSLAWQAPVGPSLIYWTVTALMLIVAAPIVVLAKRAFSGPGRGRLGTSQLQGFATRREIKRAAGAAHLSRRASVLRPALGNATCRDLGYRLGRSRGVDCWASVEDSLVVLGPPRAGKGLHTVIPAILDAPGAVITTSTRPDNLAATIDARAQVGPIAVFDP